MLYRVAILICDRPIDAVLNLHGDYFAMFKELLEKAANRFNVEKEIISLQFQPFDVIKEEYPSNLNDFDAYLVTGSSRGKKLIYTFFDLYLFSYRAYLGIREGESFPSSLTEPLISFYFFFKRI